MLELSILDMFLMDNIRYIHETCLVALIKDMYIEQSVVTNLRNSPVLNFFRHKCPGDWCQGDMMLRFENN